MCVCVCVYVCVCLCMYLWCVDIGSLKTSCDEGTGDKDQHRHGGPADSTTQSSLKHLTHTENMRDEVRSLGYTNNNTERWVRAR